MKEIERYDVNEDWAHSGIVRAGNFYFLNYCVRDTNGTIEQQVSGAFDVKAGVGRSDTRKRCADELSVQKYLGHSGNGKGR